MSDNLIIVESPESSKPVPKRKKLKARIPKIQLKFNNAAHTHQFSKWQRYTTHRNGFCM